MSIPKLQPGGTLIKALARAWRWQRMLDEGIYTSVSEIGDAEKISKSYVSLILRLALLAPDIIEMIFEGRSDQAVMLEHFEQPKSLNQAFDVRIVQRNTLDDLAMHLELNRRPSRHGGSVDPAERCGPPPLHHLRPRYIEQDRRTIPLFIGLGLVVGPLLQVGCLGIDVIRFSRIRLSTASWMIVRPAASVPTTSACSRRWCNSALASAPGASGRGTIAMAVVPVETLNFSVGD